ncbi:MAG: Hpt domain-containing protein [Bacteroidales bacterium]|nr:Hpt domain-containing protein [Bacteroidales bacterium]
MIDIFLSEYPDRLTELENNVRTIDFQGLDHNAHSFKGVVTYMSPELTEYARKLEYKGKEQNGEGLQDLFDSLKKGCAELSVELNEMRSEYQ